MNYYNNRPAASDGSISAERACIVMFSGGRDSTLAALRLFERRRRLFLVTVTSDHLFGIDSVKCRLDEFRVKLGMRATWIHVVQPARLEATMLTAHRTCLPCHAAYSALGVRLAADNNATSVAFGYTGYQSHWLERRGAVFRATTRD